jgi:glycine reductase complex component B subunit alpha and beta
MRLQLEILTIKDVQFAAETAVREGTLYVDKKALQTLLLQDQRFASVDIELAHPGEKCRITGVLDVVEPRAKTSDGDEDFPGAVGKQVSAGAGNTCVLKGTAVVLIDYREKPQSGRSSDPNGEIIDMSGIGADIGLFGKTHNIVLLAVPAQGVTNFDYLAALKAAGLRAAAYVGRASKGITPDRTEVLDIPPLMARDGTSVSLPRVVYIFQILSTQFDPIPGEPILYGGNVADAVPTLLHPNEVIDGAVTSQLPALHIQTFQIQNHPIIRELGARHGKELFFAGVIVSTAPNNTADIERISNIAANLARYVGADGAVLTKTGGGAPELTMARTAQRCEQFGIRTALAVLHMSADIYGAATLFNMPEVDAMVSLGVPSSGHMTLPPVERIVGRRHTVANSPSIDGAIVKTEGGIKGAQCQLGTFPFRAVRY